MKHAQSTAVAYPMLSEQAGYRADVQGLRALAVLLVIANHADIPGFAAGFMGVDVFFVISGFVITRLLLREADKGWRTGSADFYSRRVRRIVPAATATLVLTLLVACWALGGQLNPNLPGDVRWASLFAANYRLVETGANYFIPGIFPSLITQFWSLAVEEQFYLVFPLLVFGVAFSVPRVWRLRALAGALAVGIGFSAWWSVHTSGVAPLTAYYSPFTRFWELGLGCLTAVLMTGRPIRTARSERLAATAGVALLLIAMVVLDDHSVYPGLLAWLPCLATVLLIWAGAGGPRTWTTRALSLPTAVYIGDLSYSLYLVHYAWLKLPEQLSHPLTGWLWTTIELVGVAVTAVASYHLLENPIRRSKRLAGDRMAVALSLAVAVAAAWTASILVARLVGLT